MKIKHLNIIINIIYSNIIKVTVLIFSSSQLFAQSKVNSIKSEISGRLINESKQEIVYASIALFQNDSTYINSAISTSTGEFKIMNVPSGKYTIRIDHIEYASYTSELFTVSDGAEKTLPTIILKPADNTLDEVVITHKKALIEVKADKLIFNVASSPSASGTNGLDLLKKAPGVTLDMDNNISLLGKGGVQIYINNIPSRLSGTDLVTFLQSMTSDNIESIEIISNPSSKYEAEGNAGIINIRMKKNMALGFNGSATSSFTQGQYLRYSNGLSLNYGSEKLKTNFDITQSQDKSYDTFLDTKMQNESILDLNSRELRDRKAINIALGLEYRLTENQTLNFSAINVINQNDSDLNSRNDIFDINPTELNSILISKSVIDEPSINLAFNLNHQWELTETSNLNTALSLGTFSSDKNTYQPNTYLEADGTTVSAVDNNEFNGETDIKLWSAKTDFEKSWVNTTFSAGIKYSHISTENGFRFFDYVDEEPVLDISQSNDFNYTESVAAIYAIINLKLSETLKLDAGLRIENTDSRGQLLSDVDIDNKDVPRNYTDFFPNVGLSFDNQKNHVWALSVGRRITRPNYQDLNPFEKPISPLTIWKGNPFLKPNYIMNYQLSYSYKQKLIITNTYSVTNGFFASIFEIIGENANQIIPRNMERSTNYGISVSYPLEVSKHWDFVVFANGGHQTFKGDLEGTIIDIENTTWDFRIQNNIKLPWEILMDLTYNVDSDWIWRGSIDVRGNHDLSFGFRKDFLNKQLQVRITGADILRTTNDYFYEGEYGGIEIKGVRSFDTQRFGMGITYKFGNIEAKTKIKTKSALDDELDRIEN